MRKHKNKNLYIIILVLFLAIGFSYIASNINFDGFARLRKHKWEVIFDNVQDEVIYEGSIVSPAGISGSSGENLLFNASLDGPGSYYKFQFDVVNNGTEDIVLTGFNIDGYDLNDELQQYLNIDISSIYGMDRFAMDWDGASAFPYLNRSVIKAGESDTFELSAKYFDTANAVNEVYGFTLSLNYEAKKNSDIDKAYTFSNVLMKKSIDLRHDSVDNIETVHEPVIFRQNHTNMEDARKSYRYIGSDPYNYVRYNNELWRIIGVFKLDSDYYTGIYYTKIIKATGVGSYTFNDSRYSGSFADGPVFTYLNNTFYNNLNDQARSMIWWGTRFYEANYYPESYTNAETMYGYEKSGSYFEGNVGLMYPSDYLNTFAYGVEDDCYRNFNCMPSKEQKSWLYPNKQGMYELFMSNMQDESPVVFNSTSIQRYDRVDGKTVDLRPVVYLTGDIITTGGTGTSTDPYIISTRYGY